MSPRNKKGLDKRISEDSALIEVFKNRTRLDIILVLNIHRELSIAQLARILGKSKPTVLRHLKVIESLGFVESYIKPDEVQPGSIKRRYYSILPGQLGWDQHIHLTSPGTQDNEALRNALREYCERGMSFVFMLMRILELCDSYAQRLKRDILSPRMDLEELRESIFDELPLITMHQFTDEQFEEFQRLSSKYATKIAEILNRSGDDMDIAEHPHVYVQMNLPMVRLLSMPKNDL